MIPRIPASPPISSIMKIQRSIIYNEYLYGSISTYIIMLCLSYDRCEPEAATHRFLRNNCIYNMLCLSYDHCEPEAATHRFLRNNFSELKWLNTPTSTFCSQTESPR